MLQHRSNNALSTNMFKRSLTSYIKRVIDSEIGISHTGIVQEITNSGGILSNLIIEITDVEESPHLSWSDSHFIIREGDIFTVSDPVMLLPIRGRYFVLKIEDDFAVKINNGTGQITSAVTTDVITHGLGITPSVEDIHIAFTSTATNDIGHMWISSIGGTTFTVNVKNVPGSNLNFSWKVDIK